MWYMTSPCHRVTSDIVKDCMLHFYDFSKSEGMGNNKTTMDLA